ncbi:unnamed protein product, partial [marine sediment metagenome]
GEFDGLLPICYISQLPRKYEETLSKRNYLKLREF